MKSYVTKYLKPNESLNFLDYCPEIILAKRTLASRSNMTSLWNIGDCYIIVRRRCLEVGAVAVMRLFQIEYRNKNSLHTRCDQNSRKNWNFWHPKYDNDIFPILWTKDKIFRRL